MYSQEMKSWAVPILFSHASIYAKLSQPFAVAPRSPLQLKWGTLPAFASLRMAWKRQKCAKKPKGLSPSWSEHTCSLGILPTCTVCLGLEALREHLWTQSEGCCDSSWLPS